MSSKLRDLFLSVKCTNWRMDDASSAEADSEFATRRKSALDRDKHTCQFCGFRNLKYQEVHHFNDDHSDNRLENLVTTCPFCHMCQHIGLAGRNKEAVLIWLPEISQVDLHHVVRTILMSMHVSDFIKKDPRAAPSLVKTFREAADVGRSTMAALEARQQEAERRLTSDPLELANAMLLLPDEVYAKRRESLDGLRLLPLGRRFQGRTDNMRAQIETWVETQGPYTSLKPNSWTGLMRSVLGA